MNIRNRAILLGLAGAMAFGTAASAGPLPTGTAAVKAAASDHVTDVRWRGRSAGPGIAFGLAAGALFGAAVAARPYYYEPDYYYGGPVYGGPVYGGPVYAEPYAYEPVYPAPRYYRHGYRYGGCYTDEGYGRIRSCDSQ